MPTPWERAEQATGLPGLLDALTDLDGGALNSLLLELSARRAGRRGPADLLRQAASDPYVAACDLDQRQILRLDAAIAAALPANVDVVELSPVCPLGTVSALAVAHQNKVLSAQRQTEVLADPTNALALEVARRRAAGQTTVRLASSARVLRTPRVAGTGFSQHFRLWAFVTGGRDSGSHRFEQAVVQEHLALHHTVLEALRGAGLPLPQPTVLWSVADAHRSWVDPMLRAKPEISVRPLEGSYYRALRMNLSLPLGDQLLPISDGGFVDWVAKLRSDRKERLFISAIGTERLIRLFPQDHGCASPPDREAPPAQPGQRAPPAHSPASESTSSQSVPPQ